MQLGRRRWGVVITVGTLLSVFAVSGVASSPHPSSGSTEPEAQTAKRRHLSVVDTVRLRLVRRNGNVLYERGRATGTLPGRVSARLKTSLTKVTGRVTIRPYSGGAIVLTAVGYPQSTGTVANFQGNVAVRRGKGKYRNALGSGTLTGTVNRRTWAVTVYARANLTY